MHPSVKNNDRSKRRQQSSALNVSVSNFFSELLFAEKIKEKKESCLVTTRALEIIRAGTSRYETTLERSLNRFRD